LKVSISYKTLPHIVEGLPICIHGLPIYIYIYMVYLFIYTVYLCTYMVYLFIYMVYLVIYMVYLFIDKDYLFIYQVYLFICPKILPPPSVQNLFGHNLTHMAPNQIVLPINMFRFPLRIFLVSAKSGPSWPPGPRPRPGAWILAHKLSK